MLSNQTIMHRFIKAFVTNDTPACQGEDGSMYAPQDKGQIGCAVGMFLSLEDAREVDDVLEGDSTVRKMSQDMPEIYDKYFTPNQLMFLEDLQLAHDSMPLTFGWKKPGSIGHGNMKSSLVNRLRSICRDHELNIPRALDV